VILLEQTSALKKRGKSWNSSARKNYTQRKRKEETHEKVFAEEIVGDGFVTTEELAIGIAVREQGTTGQIRGRAYEGACSRRVGCHRRSDEHRKEEGEHSEHDELGHVGVVGKNQDRDSEWFCSCLRGVSHVTDGC
jgi:hypothetical protein